MEGFHRNVCKSGNDLINVIDFFFNWYICEISNWPLWNKFKKIKYNEFVVWYL